MDSKMLGTHPIPGAEPGGRDAKYEPEYAMVLGEIEKLGSATQGGGISWSLVVDTSANILRDQSKDFLIAAYFAMGLLETRGAAGLADGIGLLGDFLEHWWQDGFPPIKRLRGRVNALDWWRERTVNRLLTVPEVVPLSAEAFQQLCAAIERLDTLLGERLSDFSPLHDLVQAVHRLPVEAAPKPAPEAAPKPTPEPAPVPVSVATARLEAAPGAGQTGAAAASPPPVPAGSASRAHPALTVADAPALQDVAGWRDLFFSTARDFAFVGHGAAPEDPLPWQVLRQSVWGKVSQLPPSEGAVTHIPAPDPVRLDGLRSLIASGRALDAALGAENLFPDSMFWLDIQYVVAKALAELGPEFAEALAAVREETARLLRRLPGLALYCFSDATPFAREETRQWLSTLTAATGQGSGTEGDTVVDDALQLADTAYAGGDLGGALRALEAAQGTSGRRNMRLRVAQLRLLVRAGLHEPAQAAADALLEDVVACGLERWEPEFALDVLRAVYAVHRNSQRDAQREAGPNADSASPSVTEVTNGNRTRQQDVLRRIARICPSALTRDS